VHICACGVRFSQLGINGNLRWGTVGEGFSVFEKNNNGNLGWAIIGVVE
jgi:hypothetical protein